MAMNATFETMKLGHAQARQAALGLAAAADVLLILDADGAIEEVSGAFAGDLANFAGRAFAETVAAVDRDRARGLVGDGASRGRPVPFRHDLPTGAGIEVAYARSELPNGRTMLVGRVTGTPDQLAAPVVAAEQETGPPTPEARYQHLFQTISEPVMLVDPETRTIDEMNPPAASLFGGQPSDFVARPLDRVFAPDDVAWLVAAGDSADPEQRRTIRLPGDVDGDRPGDPVPDL